MKTKKYRIKDIYSNGYYDGVSNFSGVLFAEIYDTYDDAESIINSDDVIFDQNFGITIEPFYI